MKSYRINNQLAVVSQFVPAISEFSEKWGVRLAPPIPQRLAPRPVLSRLLKISPVLSRLFEARPVLFGTLRAQPVKWTLTTNWIEYKHNQFKLGGDYK